MARRRLFLAACCCLCLFAAPLVAQQQETGTIVGQIRIARSGFPSDRIKVTLTSRGAMADQQWSDEEGKFTFYNLPSNVYHVVIDDDRYQRYETEVAVNPELSRAFVISPTLTPKPDAKTEDTANRPTGSNPYIVDSATYKKQFSKQVVKEFDAGVREQEKGKFDKAIRRFQAALALAPDFYPAHNNLGAVYLAEKNFSGAQSEFEAALRLNQSDTQAYFNLGNVYLLTQRYADAQRVLQEGIKRLPSVALGHFLLGTALEHSGQAAAAEQELRKAQQLDPTMPNVRLELVNLYLQQNHPQQAITELHAFLQQFPNDPLAPRVKELLGRLEKPASNAPNQQL
jgi:tetratricopeptide (TPR) repeat protein